MAYRSDPGDAGAGTLGGTADRPQTSAQADGLRQFVR